MKIRKRIFISGPISKGDIFENIKQAEVAFEKLAKAGLAPFCPHWACYGKNVFEKTMIDDGDGCMGEQRVRVLIASPKPMTMGLTHEQFIEIDLSWVSTCDAILRLPGESIGADMETAFAVENGIPVFTDIDDLIWKMGNPK